MRENQLIKRLTAQWKSNTSVVQGVGDDCAVIKGHGALHYLLLKTDAIVEGHHFTSRTPPELIGRKALARVLSDFAAMGGSPLHALVTLGLPPKYELQRLEKVYLGVTKLARKYKINLVGGETTRTSELLLSISALGETRGFRPILRSGAQPGDALFVTGTLGLTQERKHLQFKPRLEEAQFLAQNKLATAMMDVSDGLGSDLPRLAQASGVGFQVEHLPLAAGASWEQACSDGEDYELLFSVAHRKVQLLERKWSFSTKLTRIGWVVPKTSGENLEKILPYGFDHLQNPF